MENVLVAIFIIFLILFAAFTFGEAFIDSQEMLYTSLEAMELRLAEQNHTQLIAVGTPQITDDEGVLLAFRNAGSTRLADFDEWDLIVQYFDGNEPPGYGIHYLNYTHGIPIQNQWKVHGLFMDAEGAQAEVFEPGILNPGEEIVLSLHMSGPLGAGQAFQAVLSTGSGSRASAMFRRNIPPVLVHNMPLRVTHGTIGVIDTALLLAEDIDGSPDALIYSLLTPPAEGTLTPDSTFTQADIDSRALTYEAETSGSYTFEFMISDSIDEIGPYVFIIEVTNDAPTLITNTGMTAEAAQVTVITSAMLHAADADDAPDQLTYTVTSPAAHGDLLPGPVFTQQHIDNGLLSYGPASGDADSFAFTLSDGENIIGPFTFIINAP